MWSCEEGVPSPVIGSLWNSFGELPAKNDYVLCSVSQQAAVGRQTLYEIFNIRSWAWDELGICPCTCHASAGVAGRVLKGEFLNLAYPRPISSKFYSILSLLTYCELKLVPLQSGYDVTHLSSDRCYTPNKYISGVTQKQNQSAICTAKINGRETYQLWVV